MKIPKIFLMVLEAVILLRFFFLTYFSIERLIFPIIGGCLDCPNPLLMGILQLLFYITIDVGLIILLYKQVGKTVGK